MITLSDGAASGPPPSAHGPKRRRTGFVVLVVVLVLVVAGIGLAAALGGGSGNDSANDAGTSAPGAGPTPKSSGRDAPAGSQTVQAASSSFTVGPTRPDLLKRSGSITVTKDGTTLSNVQVDGTITVSADNVTVRNFVAGNVVQEGKNLVLEDGTVNSVGAPGDAEAAVVYGDYTARHLDISHSFDGLKAHGNVTIENCWIHDLDAGPSSESAGGYTHNDGIQSSSGSHITIKDNRIERPGNNSAVFVDTDQGRIDDVQIVGNYLDGGGYTLYVVQSRSAPKYGSPTNVTVEGNVFGKEHQFGPVTLAPGVSFTDNVDAANEPIPMHLDSLSK